MMKFRTVDMEVEALQAGPLAAAIGPEGVSSGLPEWARDAARLATIEASGSVVYLYRDEQRFTARSGDFLVREPSGRLSVVTAADFAARYVAVPQ